MSGPHQQQEADGLLKLFFEHHPLPMWVYDRETLGFLAVNEAAVRAYGYTREEFLHMSLRDIRPAEDQAALDAELAERVPGPQPSRRWRHRRRDGSLLYVDIHSSDCHYRKRRAVLVTAVDITEQVRAEEQLQLQMASFRQLFQNSPDGIVVLDSRDCVLDANPTFLAMFGYPLEEMRGRPINELIVPAEYRGEASRLSGGVLANQVVHVESFRCRRDGQLIPVAILGYPVIFGGERIGIFGIYRDITEHKRATEELAHQATHDALTDLFNRREFERQSLHLIRSAAESAKGHAFIYLDLDRFKLVNDTCGHVAGDRLLVEVAHMLVEEVRTSDMVARLGGDEFALLLRDCPLPVAERIANRIVERIGEYRFRWEDKAFGIGASIGLVVIDAAVRDFKDLMTQADAACYLAKEQGRGRVQVYQPQDLAMAALRSQLDWVTRINRALDDERFELHYQRIVPLGADGDEPPRFEILLRMVDEVSGELLPPGAFIPAAERYGIMPQLDRWVIRAVFTTLGARLKLSGRCDEAVNINLSGTTLSDPRIADFVREQFAEHCIPPQNVCFEITETAAIADIQRAMGFIQAMHALGCRIALDDFGSGMSSFNYLKSLKVDFLKIDGSFVRELDRSKVGRAMVEAINRVGQVMDIRTVAEFVENAAVLRELKAMGVDYAQGFDIHRPEPWQRS